MYILAYVYGDDYCNIPILLCAGESGYSSERELLLYYCSKARESNTNCLNNQLYISSLRFHNGLTHFWGPPDNEEKLNYRAIRKQVFLNSIFNE